MELDSIEPPGCRRADDRGRRVDRKGLDGGRDRDGGNEAGNEGESEAESTKEEWKEGGSEAGRRNEEKVRHSYEAEEYRGCKSSHLRTILY